MTQEEFLVEWEEFSANFSRNVNERQAMLVFNMVRNLPVKLFRRRWQRLEDWPRNMIMTFKPEEVLPRSVKSAPLPWDDVVTGRMSRDTYWGGRKAPSQCSRQEIIKLYGPSPCDREYQDTSRSGKTFAAESAFEDDPAL